MGNDSDHVRTTEASRLHELRNPLMAARAVLSKLGVRSQLAAVGMARDRGWRPPGS